MLVTLEALGMKNETVMQMLQTQTAMKVSPANATF